MDLVATKVTVSILFGIIRLFFGLFPIKLYHILKRWEHEDDTASFINAKRHGQMTCAIALCQSFGGGVLFATCLLHMMPEVYRSVEELKEFSDINIRYPLSQLTICLGFFFVYFTEEVSHWFVNSIPSQGPVCPSKNIRQDIVTPRSNKVAPEDINSTTKEVFIIENQTKESCNEKNEVEEFETVSISSEKHTKELEEEENEKNSQLSEESKERAELEREIENENKSQQQIFRGVLVILALSLHSFFEGLAIGLQHSSVNIWYLFIAVSIHSATIMFCMGLELLLAKTKMHIIFIHIFTLSLTSPAGILLGLIITLKTNMNTVAKSVAIVFLEGLSAGTILYITFFEVLNREKHRRIYRLRRGICIMCGFVLMAILQLIEM